MHFYRVMLEWKKRDFPKTNRKVRDQYIKGSTFRHTKERTDTVTLAIDFWAGTDNALLQM